MTTEERRIAIYDLLEQNYPKPLSATAMAKQFDVSRQVIVGDVSVLRAAGRKIVSTARGYIISKEELDDFGFLGVLNCKHDREQLREELYTIVDFGATVIDVIVVHGIYGEIVCKLDLSSRYEVDKFLMQMHEEEDKPLSSLTDGEHIHTIGCKDAETFNLIKETLSRKNILLS